MIIDGKKLSEKLCAQVRAETEMMQRRPCLAAVLVGEDPASRIYVRNKERDCVKCGIDSRRYELPDTVSEAELLALIDSLNRDDAVDGILVQLPLPEHISERKVINAVAPEKDVDAFHPINVGRMVTGEGTLTPCTPAGIMAMLREYGISPDGKVSPQSTIIASLPYSRTVIFLPISLSPPNGIILRGVRFTALWLE